MLIKPSSDIRTSEITGRSLYLNRRAFIRATAGTAAAAAAAAVGAETRLSAATPAPHGRKLEYVRAKDQEAAFSVDEKPNTWEQITTYNNYYEFGADKDQPSTFARQLKTEPWTVAVEGECNKKAVYHLEDVLKGEALEERIYRHRCVEAWSLVIPWVGFRLSNFINRSDPTSKRNSSSSR